MKTPHPRLTEAAKAYPLDSFMRCQLCGHTSPYKDICEFQMWLECNDQDMPEEGNVLITCRQEACQKVIDDHPRGYSLVSWGQGLPGYFMLLCGDCPHRNGTNCSHPHLKINGGEGLLIEMSNPLGVGHVTVCTDDGRTRCISNMFPQPATSCEGHPRKRT